LGIILYEEKIGGARATPIFLSAEGRGKYEPPRHQDTKKTWFLDRITGWTGFLRKAKKKYHELNESYESRLFLSDEDGIMNRRIR
jgi:hypothetical protein